MDTMTTTRKTRTITLTDRPPVTIHEVAWPLIARATDDSGGANDDGRRAAGELDTYALRVRQHTDGRTIVYGVLGGSLWTGTEDYRGGELLEASQSSGADIVAAIRRVGAWCQLPDSVIRACIAALPAEEL